MGQFLTDYWARLGADESFLLLNIFVVMGLSSAVTYLFFVLRGNDRNRSALLASAFAGAIFSRKNERRSLLREDDDELFQNEARDAKQSYAKLLRQIEQEKDAQKKEELEQQERELNARIESLNARLGIVARTALLNVEYKFNVSDAQSLLALSHNKLRQEEKRLTDRSKDNLEYGIRFTRYGFGVAVIAAFIILCVFWWLGVPDYMSRFIAYLPFLTAGIALQIMGVFFLKTYRTIEGDITKNKNEMTNVEYRIAAILMAEKGSTAQKKAVIDRLLTEERNFILKREKKLRVKGSRYRSKV